MKIVVCVMCNKEYRFYDWHVYNGWNCGSCGHPLDDDYRIQKAAEQRLHLTAFGVGTPAYFPCYEPKKAEVPPATNGGK